jgi:hypothetical protein
MVAKEEGREEGMERGRVEMVKNMRANGADVRACSHYLLNFCFGKYYFLCYETNNRTI